MITAIVSTVMTMRAPIALAPEFFTHRTMSAFVQA
jgi:hypothetical protein